MRDLKTFSVDNLPSSIALEIWHFIITWKHCMLLIYLMLRSVLAIGMQGKPIWRRLFMKRDSETYCTRAMSRWDRDTNTTFNP